MGRFNFLGTLDRQPNTGFWLDWILLRPLIPVFLCRILACLHARSLMVTSSITSLARKKAIGFNLIPVEYPSLYQTKLHRLFYILQDNLFYAIHF